MSKNTSLTQLFCSNNQLTSLVVGENTALTDISCYKNQLTSLDVSKNTSLITLLCSNNKMMSLDLSKNISLKWIACDGNQLTNLDVSMNTLLTWIACQENQLTKLDVSKNANLTILDCSTNKISYLNISNCPYLLQTFRNGEELDCGTFVQYYCSGSESSGSLVFDTTTELITGEPTPTTPPTQPTPTTAPSQPTTAPTQPTPTTAPSQPTPPATSDEASIADFVERLYTVALGRESDPAGKGYWITEIECGSRTGADCAHFFLIEAEEFRNRGLSNSAFVEALYQTFFGRASEPNGKAYWVGELNSGAKSRNDVINGFIDSTEWCNICATYGVRSGAPTAKAEIASSNAIGFATRLYTCCLNRDPEEKGLKYWSLALTNLEQTGAEAAKLFFTSTEFKNQFTSNEEFITRLYTTFMDREPENAGFNYWVGELEKGVLRVDVLASFAQSKEFTNICKSYGIERGEI